ncbi:MAG TPA: hypothetical protein VMU17_07895, partial [Elusimicrobiota bacterium]|nr:hypothetical protein [Elusimicrobiota bacterium]
QTTTIARTYLDAATTDNERAWAYLYWGGAEGLKGRWLVTQKEWVDAYFRGKAGAKYLRKAITYNPDLYDAYMGLGIYDYFTDTLSGVQAVLAALLIHGDRGRGLRELQLAIDKGQHARVEAMLFLTEIYTFEENTPDKALPLTQELRHEFPQSPAMHLAEIMTYYSLGQWDHVKIEAAIFLRQSEQETPYYSRLGIRPALYCLGVAALMGDRDAETCLRDMNQILEGGEDSSRWVTFAHLRRGQVYDLRGQRDQALAEYRRVLARADFWGSHKEAKIYVKEPYILH